MGGLCLCLFHQLSILASYPKQYIIGAHPVQHVVVAIAAAGGQSELPAMIFLQAFWQKSKTKTKPGTG